MLLQNVVNICLQTDVIRPLLLVRKTCAVSVFVNLLLNHHHAFVIDWFSRCSFLHFLMFLFPTRHDILCSFPIFVLLHLISNNLLSFDSMRVLVFIFKFILLFVLLPHWLCLFCFFFTASINLGLTCLNIFSMLGNFPVFQNRDYRIKPPVENVQVQVLVYEGFDSLFSLT